MERQKESSNVEDRRGRSIGGKIAVGGGNIGLIFLTIQFFTEGDTSEIFNQIQNQLPATTEERELRAEEKELGEFTQVVLADSGVLSEKVVPDAFTHGTSEQRMKWFHKGYDSGNIDQGDTFSIYPIKK